MATFAHGSHHLPLRRFTQAPVLQLVTEVDCRPVHGAHHPLLVLVTQPHIFQHEAEPDLLVAA